MSFAFVLAVLVLVAVVTFVAIAVMSVTVMSVTVMSVTVVAVSTAALAEPVGIRRLAAVVAERVVALLVPEQVELVSERGVVP